MRAWQVFRTGEPRDALRLTDLPVPEPGPGEVRVRVLAAGVSFTDAQLRAGTYLGVPKPPFTPGYELVGVVEELGPGCSRLREGDRIGALTVWGADAERVCVPEANAVEVPEDLDPAEVVSLVFTYMTAYQLLHRAARVKRGETVLVHGAAGRVGTAVLELGGVAGLRLYGTCSARDRAAVERLGAVAIDYQAEDFLARVRELPGMGVDVVLDGLGGALSLRSFRALRPGGRRSRRARGPGRCADDRHQPPSVGHDLSRRSRRRCAAVPGRHDVPDDPDRHVRAQLRHVRDLGQHAAHADVRLAHEHDDRRAHVHEVTRCAVASRGPCVARSS